MLSEEQKFVLSGARYDSGRDKGSVSEESCL